MPPLIERGILHDEKYEEGEIIGYVGPNGAGKSTTIKMMTGILQPSSGKIVIDGKQPCQNRREHMKNIGVVFGQYPQSDPPAE